MSKTDIFADVPIYRKAIYSGISGAIATTCIYPIDIVKTKLQAQHSSSAVQYKSPIDCFLKLVKADGIRGIYRGWPPNVVFVMPEKALKLTANDFFRNYFRERRPNKDLPLQWEMLAGGCAGFIQVTATNPMELLKIQGATAADRLKSGELKEPLQYGKLIRSLGVSGMYTGVVSTLVRDVPFSMVYFSLYSQSKVILASEKFADVLSPATSAFLAGAIAGTTAAAITCPLDVIKTRVHASVKPCKLSLSEFVSREFGAIPLQYRNLMQKEGASALFKGIVPRCLIISPLFAITMTCYEFFQRRLG